MSIKLTTLCFNIINLSAPEKHLLAPICYHANQYDECWPSIERLQLATGLKRKAVERNLKKLRDKNILIYTGKYEGRFQNIPVYRINLDYGHFDRDQSETTVIYTHDTGHFELEIMVKMTVHKDNMKNNRKDNAKSSFSSPLKTPSVTDHQEYAAGVKGYEWVGEWVKLNKSD